jgi:predicted ester cyclase
MSPEENKSLFRQWIRDTDDPSGSLDWIERWMAPDFRAHLPGAPETLDRAGYRAYAAAFQRSFRAEEHVIHHLVAEGDMVAGRISFNLVHTGEFQGYAGTGRRIALDETVFARLRDGKLVEVWTLVDRGQLVPTASGG